MNLRTRLRTNNLWNLYRIKTKVIREVLVLNSFRHRYSEVSHAEGFHINNICKAMGHSQEVQLKNYSKFLPEGTSRI